MDCFVASAPRNDGERKRQVRQIGTTGKISLYQNQNSVYKNAIPSRSEGRAHVTNVGRGCGGRESCAGRAWPTRTAKACGPDVAVLASMLLGDIRFPRAPRRQKSCSPGRARHK